MDQSSVIFISIMSAAGLAVLVFAAFLVSRRWKRRRRSQLMDEMEGHDFEYFCADLLRKTDSWMWRSRREAEITVWISWRKRME